MRAITANLSSANPQALIRLDNWWSAALGVQIAVNGTASWTLFHSYDDPNDLVSPVPVGSMVFDHSLVPAGVVGGTASTTFFLATAPTWARLTLNNGLGSARETFTQYSQHHSMISPPMPPTQFLQLPT